MKYRHVQFTQKGGPEVLTLIEGDCPKAQPGQVRVKIEYCGVGFSDVMMRYGVYPNAPPFPFTPGYEIIEIAASAAKLWAVLTDFPGHEGWNPFMKNVRGTLQENAHVQFDILPPGGQPRSFHPKVLKVVETQEIRWANTILFPAFFHAEHYFTLVSQGANQTRFIQGELFRGLLVNFIWSTLDRNARAGFVAMNQALKLAAER